MADFIINDRILSEECQSIAQGIIDEFKRESPDELLSDSEDHLSDAAHQAVDGHSWVIYNHQALMICAHCDVSEGEAFLEDVGMPETPTIYSIACLIVFGEMRARVEEAIRELVQEEDEAADDL